MTWRKPQRMALYVRFAKKMPLRFSVSSVVELIFS